MASRKNSQSNLAQIKFWQYRPANFRFFFATQKCARRRLARKFLTIIGACSEEDMAPAVPIGAAGEKFYKNRRFFLLPFSLHGGISPHPPQIAALWQ